MKYKKVFAIFISIIISLGLSGCSRQKDADSTEYTEEIKIPMLLTVDPSTGNKNEEDVITAFNEEYKGRYQIDVEWMLQTEEEYRTNLKRLNVTDGLPAIITDLRLLPSFYQLMLKDERIEDLSPLINKDKEWKNMIEPAVLEACTESDGSIYLAPLSTAFYSCSGVFWNEQLFHQAGIEHSQKHGRSSGIVVKNCRIVGLHRLLCIQKVLLGHRCSWRQRAGGLKGGSAVYGRIVPR